MNLKEKIGNKIKERRKALRITQSALCCDEITRNMLSLIENGKAFPSIPTAQYLCERLDLPLGYLFSDDDNLFYYEKEAKIDQIRALFKKQNYLYCINIIDKMSSLDDELAYIYANCAFCLCRQYIFSGSLITAEKYLLLAEGCISKTIYNTQSIKDFLPLYKAVIRNIEAPLLEFEADDVIDSSTESQDMEFLKYITLDYTYSYKNPIFSLHLDAKKALKRYSYMEAIELLNKAESHKNSKEYNSAAMLSVYTDIEYAYKQIGDFENAYRYSTKRISLLSGFKS